MTAYRTRSGFRRRCNRYAASALVLAAALLAEATGSMLPAAQVAEQSVAATTIEHEGVAMRDGIRLDTNIYLPKGNGPFPTILVRTPYPFAKLGEGRDKFLGKLVEHGYAVVVQNERGMYLSGGRHEYLAKAGSDGVDTLDWIVKQPWSTGKIGTWGCSSTAEDQLALIAQNHPAHRAAVVLGFGAGIGRIGPFAEQGNTFRGGALQLLFASWYKYYIGGSGRGADLRPTFPGGLSREQKTQLSKLYSLRLTDFAGDAMRSTAEMLEFYNHLPAADIIKASGGPLTDWDDFARRTPADPAWAKTEFANEGDTFGVPAIWGVSWYDVSVGPNLYLFDYARQHIAQNRPKDEQFLIASPGTHCTFQRQPGNIPIGERDVGDATYDYDKRFLEFFDWKLKGIDNGASREPRVLTYQMGENRWVADNRALTAMPRYVDYYLTSETGANSVYGDGRLVTEVKTAGKPFDSFVYDPQRPVPTLGGGACCMGGIPAAGAYDQAPVEAREDVLVYSTPPLAKPLAVRGAVAVELFVASDAPDTDLAVKLTDVYPDGRSFNLDDTIFRVRYRDGYARPKLMKSGEVYKVSLPPMFTANTFLPGHRIRVQITSSNFPRYDRNLNTGEANSESGKMRAARNRIYHSAIYPARIRLALDRPVGGTPAAPES